MSAAPQAPKQRGRPRGRPRAIGRGRASATSSQMQRGTGRGIRRGRRRAISRGRGSAPSLSFEFQSEDRASSHVSEVQDIEESQEGDFVHMPMIVIN